MFNGFKPEDTRTDQQILDDWADQYDGTLPDKLKKFFKQKAESVFTQVLATEAAIKDALRSRESIRINEKKITKEELDKIPLMQLLHTEGITIDERARHSLDNPTLDAIVSDAAKWEAINLCGLTYYFARVYDEKTYVELETLNQLNKNIQNEISNALAEKYNCLKPLETFKHDDSLYLYQNLNYAFMMAATTTMVCGALMSLPCLIIGFLSLALSMYIQQYLTEEIENRHMYKA